MGHRVATPFLERVVEYFERFGFCRPQIAEAPDPHLGLVTVIPCFNEPDLVRSLESLRRCGATECSVEVIVVINSPEGAEPAVLEQNERSFREGTDWAEKHQSSRFRVHLLDCKGLPRKSAGVGLARKIGMDEALRRFTELIRPNGIILCFDADCECDPNYFRAVEHAFHSLPGASGSSIYFEHPLDGPEPDLNEAVTHYELHLRYYVEALRRARFPYAFHTVGSSMAVRADAYFKQGGMNKRQAGEDFYFLHKIIPLGGFVEINRTRVIPSPRPSERVPFGTGRAVRGFLVTGHLETYPLQAFDDLQLLFERVSELRQNDIRAALAPPLQSFLESQRFDQALNELRSNTRSLPAFEKRFFGWFDGFRVMKYIHHARDTLYGPGDLQRCAEKLLAPERTCRSVRELLLCYRERQRG